MKIDTPLPEVAHLLPAESCQRLLGLPVELQVRCLTDIRLMLVLWESSGVALDPITLAKVIAPVVEMLAQTSLVIYKLRTGLGEGMT